MLDLVSHHTTHILLSFFLSPYFYRFCMDCMLPVTVFILLFCLNRTSNKIKLSEQLYQENERGRCRLLISSSGLLLKAFCIPRMLTNILSLLLHCCLKKIFAIDTNSCHGDCSTNSLIQFKQQSHFVHFVVKPVPFFCFLL